MVPKKSSSSVRSIIFLFLFSVLQTSCGNNEPVIDDHSRLTKVDEIAHNYLQQEEFYWNSVFRNSSYIKDSILQQIYSFHQKELNLNYGKIETVAPVSEVLVELIDSINRTQYQVSQILIERKYGAMKNFAEETVQHVTDKVKRIFEEVDKGSFLTYFRSNSDQCQKPFMPVNDPRLYTDNVMLGLYKTIAESLIKGYMMAQMFHMVLAQEVSGMYKQSFLFLVNFFICIIQTFLVFFS